MIRALTRIHASSIALVACSLMTAAAAGAQVTGDVPAGRPDAIVDLATVEGTRLVKGRWRYSDAKIVDVPHPPSLAGKTGELRRDLAEAQAEAGRSVGADLKASGPPTTAYDIAPHAGAADFDDRSWEIIDPSTLDARRSKGRLAFSWYRINVTIPERVASFNTAGSTVVLEVVVDDYAEIWVDGRLPLTLGQAGGALVKGWNAPNRVIITRDARPGQKVQIAVFGMNAPISDPPPNFIWLRSATLDFYKPSGVGSAVVTEGDVLRLDPALDEIVARAAKIEKLASGFGFTEGPVWSRDGYLLFSDPNNNHIYRWNPDGQVSVYRTKSGYAGMDIGEYKQPGSNGLAFDREGRLTIAEHGRRRISRVEKNGVVTVLADRYEGKRLNSPNDLVYKSDGSLYFTDPPFGLPRVFDDGRKELPYSGVFRWSDGKLQLLATDLTGPNGIAFSLDEKFLYVANWDTSRKVVMRYEVAADGTLAGGSVFFDMTLAAGEEALDGVKVDQRGNLFVSGPGGVWIISADGRHIGTIRPPELPANMAWGDADGRTLYMTGRSSVYRIRLKIPGAGWPTNATSLR
jgi:gluconolactonase